MPTYIIIMKSTKVLNPRRCMYISLFRNPGLEIENGLLVRITELSIFRVLMHGHNML